MNHIFAMADGDYMHVCCIAIPAASDASSSVSPPRVGSGRSTTPVQMEMGITEQIARKAGKSTVLDDDLNSSGSNEIWRQSLTADQKPCWVLTEFGIETLIGSEYRITTRVPMLPVLNQQSYSSSSNPMAFIPRLRSPLRPKTPLSSFTARESARIGFGVNLLDEKQLASLSRTAESSPKSRPPSPPRSPDRASAAAVGKISSSGALTDRSPSKVRQFGNTLPANRPATDDGTSGLHRSHPSPSQSGDQAVMPSWSLLDPSPSISPQKAQTHHSYNSATSGTTTISTSHATNAPLLSPSPTTQPFAMEISPPRVNLGTLRRSEVYLFPVRVRNVGFKQERFRVKSMSATCAGFDAAIAEASCDKEAARLAPGLAAILALTPCFQPSPTHGRYECGLLHDLAKIAILDGYCSHFKPLRSINNTHLP